MKSISLVLILSWILISCENKSENIISETENNQVIESVTASSLKSALLNSIQLVDVRTQEEFEEGHIANAINMDVLSNDFKSQVQALDKSKPVYVYCKVGKRGADAAQKLESLGFSKIYNLEGGYKAWQVLK